MSDGGDVRELVIRRSSGSIKASCKKYDEWEKLVKISLGKAESPELTQQCKWLIYWYRKLSQEDPMIYLAKEGAYLSLLRSSALKLRDDNYATLEGARKHKRGSKVRFRKLLKHIYQYQRYVHPLMMKFGMAESAREVVEAFNSECLDEVVMNAEYAEGYQAKTMIEYISCCKDVDVLVSSEIVTVFQDIFDVKMEDDPSTSKDLLDKARVNISEGRWVQSLTLLGEALRECVFFLYSYHIGSEDDYYEPAEGEINFLECLSKLKYRGIIHPEESLKFVLINEAWYNKITDGKLEKPDNQIVEERIEDVWRFIRRNWRLVMDSDENL